MPARTPPKTALARALRLLDEIRNHGWIIEFVASPTDSWVHVVAADADQPVPASIVEWLMFKQFRTICGRHLRLQPLDGTIGEFDDEQERLCPRCHDAFPEHEDQALIFEHNTDSWQRAAASSNASIRAGRMIEANRPG